MTKITCIVLTKNEELTLPSCLKSLQWVDELIVLDSGSTDRTIDIARKFGAKVYVHIPQSGYSPGKQRNWAIDNCGISNSWVFFLDADEIVTDELRKEILSVIENPGGKIGFRISHKNMFMGKWIRRVTFYPSRHDRILRKGALRYSEDKRDNFIECCSDLIGVIKEPIVHHYTSKGIEDRIARYNDYTSQWAEYWMNELNKEVNWKDLLCIKDKYKRKQAIKKLFIRFPEIYPFSRFLYTYFVRLGFLDGYPGFVYCLLMLQYDLMLSLKVIEFRRKRKGLPF